MPQVSGRVVKERAAVLRAKGNILLASYLSEHQGRSFDVLFENDGNGRTPHFTEVEMCGERIPARTIVNARITGMKPTRLLGEVGA